MNVLKKILISKALLMSFFAFADTEGKVMADFHNVDIRGVTEAISEITGKNFIMDNRVRGKITILCPKPITIEQAYSAYLSALEMNGFTVVEVDGFNKVVPIIRGIGVPVIKNFE